MKVVPPPWLGVCVATVVAFAALSQDNRLQVQLYPGLSITGSVGSVHAIQFTSELKNSNNTWTCLGIIQLTNEMHLHVDTTAASAQRVYRTERLPHDVVWISPGTFVMGSPTTETGRNANEGPQTTVILTRGFFMGRHEVTQGEYLSIMKTNPSAFAGDLSLPVETVSWSDAIAFCARLTQVEQAAGRLPDGWSYRLPTEAQWEYACRAGSTARFSFGEDPNYTLLPAYAWFGDPTLGRTHTVGTRFANPWGLYDMHGNVWELCQDVITYTGGIVTDPPATGGSARVSRGGSWHSLGPRCRSATRNPYDTVNREAWVGFRVILAATQ